MLLHIKCYKIFGKVVETPFIAPPKKWVPCHRLSDVTGPSSNISPNSNDNPMQTISSRRLTFASWNWLYGKCVHCFLYMSYHYDLTSLIGLSIPEPTIPSLPPALKFFVLEIIFLYPSAIVHWRRLCHHAGSLGPVYSTVSGRNVALQRAVTSSAHSRVSKFYFLLWVRSLIISYLISVVGATSQTAQNIFRQ
jgi:hypothetical protein